MRIKSLLLLLALACTAGRLAAQNLVANGSFESGDLTGWSTSQPDGVNVFTGAPAQSGSYGVALGSSVNTDLFQWLTTEVGVSYDLSLWLSVDNGGSYENQFTASIGGVDFLSLVNAPGSAFAETHHTFIATSTSTLLNFNHTYSARFFYVDNVSVTATPTPIPEPATGVAAAGLAALGLAAWRRRLARQA